MTGRRPAFDVPAYWAAGAGEEMANAEMSCPKCKSPREVGHVLDRRHLNASNLLTWIAGAWAPPTLKERILSDPLKGKRYRAISSYRCIHCGYLEIYAK